MTPREASERWKRPRVPAAIHARVTVCDPGPPYTYMSSGSGSGGGSSSVYGCGKSSHALSGVAPSAAVTVVNCGDGMSGGSDACSAALSSSVATTQPRAASGARSPQPAGRRSEVEGTAGPAEASSSAAPSGDTDA